MQLKHIFPLSLLILATTALLLAAACSVDSTPTWEPTPYLEPPPTLAPFPDAWRGCDVKLHVRKETMPDQNRKEMIERINAVREKYKALIERQPTRWGTGTGLLRDAEGRLTEGLGITIHVEKKVDQSTLPPKDRMPDCLDGIPVQIIEASPPLGDGTHGRKIW